MACRPTDCASAAAEARSMRSPQKSHDLARRRRSAASAGWAARHIAVQHTEQNLAGHIRLLRLITRKTSKADLTGPVILIGDDVESFPSPPQLATLIELVGHHFACRCGRAKDRQ